LRITTYIEHTSRQYKHITMKTKITYRDLVAMEPCYHPKEIGIKSNYSATITEFIKEYRDKVKNKEDISWVLCRNDYMSNKDLRLFAVWCAREALKLIPNPDARSVNACDVAERYANGDATLEELIAAGAAAWAAAGAARAAAWSATWAAAWDAAGAAAWAAARTAVGDAAKAAAWAAAGTAQIDKLLTYFD